MAVITGIEVLRQQATRRGAKALVGYVALASTLLACPLAAQAAPGKQVEKLDRGVVAIHTAGGNFVSWRALGTDPSGLAFNVYRGAEKLNQAPLAATNLVDTGAPATASYSVRPVVNGIEQPGANAGATWQQPYRAIPVQKPADGVTPDGRPYRYEINDGSAADLDGDGSYELLVKWQPTNAHDNSQRGFTGNTILDAYKLDGTRLWRIDLGRNIRAGAHYTTYLAYDFDGDGKAEVMMKTADGTIDGQGRAIGDLAADHRNPNGYILKGPEYITVFNGQTGAAMASAGYLPARGDVASWGDEYGNRVDRFLGSVAYLDGARPSAIFSRGYYTRAVIAAWDWRDGKLSSRWVFDSDSGGAAAGAYHQGAHWMSIADVNGDGKDDIIYGAATIGSDGKLLYSTGLCHGDALHVGKLDPNRPGLQVFMVHETPSCYHGNGVEMHDAATGKILWSFGETGDIGRGTCMDIDPAYPGEECWATIGGLMNASGKQISSAHPRKINFGIWWDGDLLRESLDRALIEKWNPKTERLETLLDGGALGAASINGTKAVPVLSADLFGDWREEVVWRSEDSNSLLVFSTPHPTSHRLTTLMHNPQYRVQVAGQNGGYNQPPHPSFFLGEGMAPAPQEPIYVP
jgi:rhamnogalacturonan endolyase